MKTMTPHPSCAEFVYSAIQGFESILHFHLALGLRSGHFPFSQCSKESRNRFPLTGAGMRPGKLTFSLELPQDT